jgi:hypothetical protein
LLTSELQKKNPSTVMQAGSQTRFCPARPGASQTAAQPVASPPLRLRAATHLAETILQFQRLERTQTHRETTLPASQSGAARLGGVARTVALEQLPRLFSWRSWAPRSQRVGSPQDEGTTTGRVRARPETADCPLGHFSKSARSGAPPVVSCHRSKTTPRYTFHADVAHPPSPHW